MTTSLVVLILDKNCFKQNR